MKATPSLVVVGSINVDLVIELDSRPTAGQTVSGHALDKMPGGKGANQAAAAARAGAATSLLAAVGRDSDGQAMLAGLAAQGVNTDAVRVVDAPTGTAVVLVTPDGENSIVVVAGANSALTPEDVTTVAFGQARRVGCVMSQLEVPEDVAISAGHLASTERARFVLNASPLSGGLARLREVLMPLADPLVVNLGEAHALLGQASATGEGTLERAASALVQSGARSAVVTGGADGAGWAERSAGRAVGSPSADVHSSGTVPAAAASVVDTTGAGDAFTGALAAALTHGYRLCDAVESGVEAGARATEWRGAQPWSWSH